MWDAKEFTRVLRSFRANPAKKFAPRYSKIPCKPPGRSPKICTLYWFNSYHLVFDETSNISGTFPFLKRQEPVYSTPFRHWKCAIVFDHKYLFSKTRAPAPGAWKCNFSPFWEIMTDRPTNRPTDKWQKGSYREVTHQKTNKILRHVKRNCQN